MVNQLLKDRFDITPAELVTALITEKGVVHHPAENRILKHFSTNNF